MGAAKSLPRLRAAAISLLLALLLVAGAAPAAPAQAQTAATTISVTSGSATSTAAASEVEPIAEAYLLLVDHYAVPLDPAQLVAAGEAGMAAALNAAGASAPASDAGAYGTSTVEQFAALQDQFQTLAAAAGSPLSAEALAHAAIQGMADSLGDPHTSFYTPEDYQEELRWQRGDAGYAGIGVRLHGPQATVQEVFPGSPAERAGLQPGDTLVAVNGQLTADLKLADVVKLVRGDEGTSLVLGVQRASTDRVEAITLRRAQVSEPLVASRRLAGDIGYVQLRGFPEASVVGQVEQAIRQQQAAGVKGIVLDLRGNAGGRIVVGEQLLADFVPNGPIYQSVDRDGHRDVHEVRNAHPILTVPLAVLIDEGTASMGEIFAAAIQERGVGRLVGETTAGAVAASRIIPLSDGSALQFSVEQVYSGAGALLDRVGVHPDDEVALDLDALRQGRDTQLERAVSDLQAGPDAAAPAGASAAPIRIDPATAR
ncbi:MAG TPA: S41 family peptidase [Chloroflexota bacterium]|nr:S41 family peptidase [Chloroflexota bacterium]